MAGSASQEEPEPAQKRQKVKSEGHGEESSAPAASQPSNPPDAGQAHAGIGEFAPLLAAAASTNAAERTRRIAALLEVKMSRIHTLSTRHLDFSYLVHECWAKGRVLS